MAAFLSSSHLECPLAWTPARTKIDEKTYAGWCGILSDHIVFTIHPSPTSVTAPASHLLVLSKE